MTPVGVGSASTSSNAVGAKPSARRRRPLLGAPLRVLNPHEAGASRLSSRSVSMLARKLRLPPDGRAACSMHQPATWRSSV